MDEIMSGEASQVQMSAFLTALAIKKATIEEITACARGMRNHCERFLNDQDALEIVGTGGDKSGSFNISTTASFVISAAGIPVAKHGNRSATSKSGAADCLEALGAKITLKPEQVAEVFKKLNYCFMFAQNFHLSMKYVAPVRKELPIPTVFNLLGPLTNPAGAKMQLMGVYDEELVEPLAHVLSNLGVTKGMVVYGQDGLDEISVSAPTTVCEINNGQFTKYEITPQQFGLRGGQKSDIIGGTPEENANITKDILNGGPGPKRDAVLLNAGAAIHIATGCTIAEGVKQAADLIDSGKAKARMDEYVALTNQLAEEE